MILSVNNITLIVVTIIEVKTSKKIVKKRGILKIIYLTSGKGAGGSCFRTGQGLFRRSTYEECENIFPGTCMFSFEFSTYSTCTTGLFRCRGDNALAYRRQSPIPFRWSAIVSCQLTLVTHGFLQVPSELLE